MAIFKLKSKLFYTKQQIQSYNAGKKAGMQNAQKRVQKQMLDLQNKNKALTSQVNDLQNQPKGGGLLVGLAGGVAGTVGFGAIRAKRAEENSQYNNIGGEQPMY